MFLRVPEGCPSLQLTAISEYSNNQYPCSWEWNDQDISFPTLSLGLKSGWTSIINASLESLKQTILQLYTYYPQSIHQAKQPQQTSMKINVKSSTGTPNQLSLHSSPIISHCFWQSNPPYVVSAVVLLAQQSPWHSVHLPGSWRQGVTGHLHLA